MSRRKQSRPFKVQDDDDDVNIRNSDNKNSRIAKESTGSLLNGHGHRNEKEEHNDSPSEINKYSIDETHTEDELPINRIKRKRMHSEASSRAENRKNEKKTTENSTADDTGVLTEKGEKVLHQCQDSANNNDEKSEIKTPIGTSSTTQQEHITLEALQNTKVAVAQFAATALAKGADESAIKDLALLQSTLFTLHHQQVFQLQLIEHLQSELKKTNTNKDAKRPKSQSDVGKKKEESKIEKEQNSSETKPSTQLSDGKRIVDLSRNEKTEISNKKRTERSEDEYRISSSLASSIITNHDAPVLPNETNTLQMLEKRTEEVLDSASHSFSTGNLIDELSYRTGACFSDGKQVVDPALKHRCRFCGKIFGSDSALQIHLRSHTGERPFKCSLCPSSFTTKGNLKVHYQRHTEMASPFDLLEKQNFSPVSSFPTKVDNNQYSHGDADFRFLAKNDKMQSNLHEPNASVSTNSNFPQELKNWPKISDNEPHVETTRPSSINQQKEIEKNNFYNLRHGTYSSRKKAWENFMEIKNTPKASELENDETNRINPNKCPICHRVLSCRSALRQHYRTHTGERPFRCRICGRSFTTKGNLKTHISVHELDPLLNPSHDCTICHKKYSTAQALQQHINTHTGEPIEMTIDQIRAAEVRDYIPKDVNAESYVSSSSLSLGDYNDLSTNENSIEYELKRKNDEINDHKECDVASVSKAEEALNMKKGTEKLGRKSHCLKQPVISASFDFYQKPVDPVNLSKKTKEEASPSPQMDFLSKFPPIFGTIPPSLTSPHLIAPTNFNSMLIPNHYNQLSFSPHLLSNDKPDHRDLMMEQTSPYANINGSIIDFVPGFRGHTTCNICLKTFACHSALEIHYRSHTKERPYKCSICNRGFSTKGNMKQHMLTHKIRDMPQHVFGNSTQSPSSDSGNSRPSSGFQRQSLNETSQDFCDDKPNTDHLPQRCTITPEKQENTDDDGDDDKVSDQRDSYLLSDESVSMSPKLQSTQNEVMDGNESGAEAKLSLDDERKSNGSCNSAMDFELRPSTPSKNVSQANDNDEQGRTLDPIPLPRISEFKSGVAEAETPSNPKHLCTICNKYLSSSSSVQIHMRTHTGAKPFSCSVCKKSFSTKGNLKVHMGTHMWSNGSSRRGRRMSLEMPKRFPQPDPYSSLHQPSALFHPFMSNSMAFQQRFHEASLLQKYPYSSQTRDFPPDVLKRENKSLSDRNVNGPVHYPLQRYSNAISKYDEKADSEKR